jgi:hypothetical protein
MSAECLPLDKSGRKDYYYSLRHKHAYDYAAWDTVKEASVLYFLIETRILNGIYQLNINTNNRYGTPSGLSEVQKDKVYERVVVEWWHKNLQNASILSGVLVRCFKVTPNRCT